MNIENAKRISEAMITPQKSKQLNNALSLNGLYEIIKNIFTFGSVTREKEQYYKEFYSKLRDNVITQDVTHRLDIPDEFSIQVNKFTVHFSKSNDDGGINIKISSPDTTSPLEFHIDTIIFKRACTTLLIREMSGNSHKNESLLNEKHKMNFRGHIFKDFEFPGIILCGSCFENTQFDHCKFIDVDLKNSHFIKSHASDFNFIKSRDNNIHTTHTGITEIMEEIITIEEYYINKIEFKNCTFYNAIFIIPYSEETKTFRSDPPTPIKKTISAPSFHSPAVTPYSTATPAISEVERSSSIVNSLVSDIEY